IWVGGTWPNKPMVRRAARWDGVFPAVKGWPEKIMSPEDYDDLRAAIALERASETRFEMALATSLEGDAPARTGAAIAAYERAGVTWWMQEARSHSDARS